MNLLCLHPLAQCLNVLNQYLETMWINDWVSSHFTDEQTYSPQGSLSIMSFSLHIFRAPVVYTFVWPPSLSPHYTLSFQPQTLPALAHPTVHSGTNLWVAVTWDKAPWASQPCHPWHNKQGCFQSVLNSLHEASWSQLVGPEQRLRARVPAHNADSSKQEAVPLATSMKWRALLSVLLSFRCGGRKSEAGGWGKADWPVHSACAQSPHLRLLFLLEGHRHVTWPSLGWLMLSFLRASKSWT